MAVRQVVIIALVAGACWLAWRWAARGHRHPWSLTALAVLLVATSFFEIRWLNREQRYTDVATALVGRDVYVHCQRTAGFLVDVSGYMGYVPYPSTGTADDAYLRNDTCRDLGSYLSDTGARAHPSAEQVRAVHVLTHEAMHMAGEHDEAVAECQAMQRDAVTAAALGATPAQAAALARSYYRDGYQYTPDEYHSSDCGPGGRLDERLPDPPWSDAA